MCSKAPFESWSDGDTGTESPWPYKYSSHSSVGIQAWAYLSFACFGFTVRTKADGSFRLENITTGTYTIHAQKEHLYFEMVTIKIAPNTPQLADLIATG